MFPPEWSLWCVFLMLHGSAGDLEITGYDSNEVICSKTKTCSLSDCKVEEFFLGQSNDLAVHKLKPEFKLCCKKGTECELCLVIEMEISIRLDKDMEDEGQSGDDDEADKEETINKKASVTVCYTVLPSLDRCKKVGFTINHAAVAQQNQTEVSIVITQSHGFTFSSQVIVYTTKDKSSEEKLVAPSLDEVCSQKQLKHTPECDVPIFQVNLNQTTNQVELEFGNKSHPSLCLMYEENGYCQKLTQTTVPLPSVTPCMCFKAWYEKELGSRQVLHCPFKNKGYPLDLQQNVWKNLSVKARLSKMNDKSLMLLWNLTAPCRLEGEVQLCHDSVCNRINNPRKQFAGGEWKQNSKGFWENRGAFENINELNSQCVMVKIHDKTFGPFCSSDTGRFRWSLLVVGVMLLFCLTALIIYFRHDLVKKWVWSWRHGGFVKIGRKGHMVLLSPPYDDEGVSESTRQLGFLLCSQGFSVSVDQWSRKEQWAQGPLLWLHSQMLKVDSMGGRILLILTPETTEKTKEWCHLNRDGGAGNQLQLKSPYSDLFNALMLFIHSQKKLGRAAERFVLVKFDSNQKQCQSKAKSLPELLQGLPLFQLPSQTQSLLAELTVVETQMKPAKRTWMGWWWRPKTNGGEIIT